MANAENISETKITFIIPTIGRSTLIDSIKTLLNQTNSKWKAIIIFDGIEPTLFIDDERIKIIQSKKMGIDGASRTTGRAGYVRNFGITYAETEWVAFLDDDDGVKNTYVATFYDEIKYSNNDIIIFRMDNIDGILPPHGCSSFFLNHVGISFTVKKNIFEQVKFPEEVEFNTREDCVFCYRVFSLPNIKNAYIQNKLSYYKPSKTFGCEC